MAISKSTEDERERLEQAIVALEAQRAILGDEAADLAIASLRRELAGLETAAVEPGHRVEGERRVVTILFCDVTGSTALAGTCPVTVASGKHKRVIFRHACDTEFRQITQQWARCSLRKSVWAVAYWQQVRSRSASDHDAYRRLANRWLAVLWKLWQSREPYDEAYHLQQRRLRSQPLA